MSFNRKGKVLLPRRSNLQIVGAILGEDVNNTEVLLSWLEDTLLDSQQMSNVTHLPGPGISKCSVFQ
jgi:hypothetical protein